MAGLPFSLTDMVLYNKDAYLGAVEAYQSDFRPALPVSIILTLYMLYRLWTRGPQKDILWVLGLSWIFCGWVFFRTYYVSINWGAPKIAWVFILQGGLLLCAGYSSKEKNTGSQSGVHRIQQGFFTALAVVYPFLGRFEGRSWTQLDWPLMSHSHVLLLTLAVLPLIQNFWRWILCVIPLFWALFRGAFAWELGLLEFYGIVGAMGMLIFRIKMYTKD